ncbi:hypothetical protein TREMEDRAFT_57461 [Tremella mesenterica DSM 1558]|nr:uncharacterized protein TREMEDRAFT_57461 [Tremella mesenterica DSM 1558]EIW68136.1 hypothetical protein TREMEDRAFT_57461 [Tremella mesenterica DSM 1558]
MIAKIITIECFEKVLDPETNYEIWIRGGATQMEIQQQVNREYLVLSQLAILDPPVIPRVLGLWGGLQRDYQVWVMIMEFVGEKLEGKLGKEDKAAVVNLYERLHAAGVLHGDVRRRHMRRRREVSNPQAIRLIDFDRAIVRSQLSEGEWRESVENEMKEVINVLQFD